MKFVDGALSDADIILLRHRHRRAVDRAAAILENIRHSAIPTIVVINKIDLSNPEALDALGRPVARNPPRSADRPRLGPRKVQHRGALPDHPLPCCPKDRPSTPKETLTDKPCVSSPRDHPREDSPFLRQGDPPTAAKSASTPTRRSPRSTASPPRSTSRARVAEGNLIGHKGEKLKRVGQTARE